MTVELVTQTHFKLHVAFTKFHECSIFQLGRQLQMQNAMRERQMSMQLAGAREMFNWLAAFYGIATIGMFAG